MNDSRVSKLIKFEGAGWAGADSSKATDMLNCRVRTTFINDFGKKIYLEMSYFDNRSGRSESKWHKGFEMPWHIWHLFYTDDKDKCRSADFGKPHEIVMDFNKKNVLWFLNHTCNASFTELETINWENGQRQDEYWDGFAHTGNAADDFHLEGVN